MINFKKIVHYLHLDKLFDSIKECHKDNRGGFLIPTSSKVTDSEYARYRHLPINWALAPITKDDLPDEFMICPMNFHLKQLKLWTCLGEKQLICHMNV